MISATSAQQVRKILANHWAFIFVKMPLRVADNHFRKKKMNLMKSL